jgi:hypothetical protein
MHKSATKCNKILSKWCKNKHEASKIMDTLETYQRRCRGGKRRLLQGEFRTHILYFVLSFAFTLFSLASFYQKHKKN